MHTLLIPAQLLLFSVLAAPSNAQPPEAPLGQTVAAQPWNASWIWKTRERYDTYNDIIEARRNLDLPDFNKAVLRITADSYYRLYINGSWVNDGPARSWPSHYQYDIIDVTPYLKTGQNEIRVFAQSFGIGTFHQFPQEAGLLAQLFTVDPSGKIIASYGSDTAWEVRDATAWNRFAPKQSVQLGPYEIYDARKESNLPFEPAVIRYAAEDGPWKDLNPRDCPLLSHIPFPVKAFTSAQIVQRPAEQSYIFLTSEYAYDGVVPANNHVAMSGAYATCLIIKEKTSLSVDADDNQVLLDGKTAKDNQFSLEPGTHFLFCALSEYFGHWHADAIIRLQSEKPIALANPLDGDTNAAWCYLPFKDGRFQTTDREWSLLKSGEKDAITARLDGLVKQYAEQAGALDAFKSRFANDVVRIQPEQITEDIHGAFKRRVVAEGAAAPVENPQAAISGAGDTLIQPAPQGDVELIYDLGEQNIGFWKFEVDAAAGTIIDIAAVEYQTPTGRLQHTDRYRNSMRYICKDGNNQFTSLMRRSGKYLVLTFRNMSAPVKLRNLQLIESTYPVKPIGNFACSDERLNKIWEISARTLKLCMEDTFTDCPLYEQTHWVGDARNEALFSYTAFGSADIARRCARISAYSLEKSPLVLSQTPSTWEIVIPAYNFLWTIAVWDYYFYSGDQEFLAWAYPYIIKNLKNAEQFSDDRGLFSLPAWNMFDWAGIDDNHPTVTHNSMFAVGAIQAALQTADVLKNSEHTQWLRQYQQRLINSVNALWDDKRGWYPDSVRESGGLSPKTCVHTGFLSLLYDIAPKDKQEAILEKVLNPPKDMTTVGSPFASLYLFDALEKAGRPDEVLRRIHDCYQVMLDLNATTVWETFPGSTVVWDNFPTRSHCHAWSASPLHFLNRIVLGITQEAVGGKAYRISPRISDLQWAKGASASLAGPIEVSWRLESDTIIIDAKAPEGVALRFERNDSMKDKKVLFNGQSF